ncbi:MAG TPA: hypothetical protein VGJ60_20295 [Chloroflexota bacterium]
MGGRYTVRALTYEERHTRLKFFTHAQLKRAAHIAFERDYNRQLDLDFVDSLEAGTVFPITFTLPHEHSHGQRVPTHMRCNVIFDGEGNSGFIDTDMDLFNSLGEWDAPDPRGAAAPSLN